MLSLFLSPGINILSPLCLVSSTRESWRCGFGYVISEDYNINTLSSCHLLSVNDCKLDIQKSLFQLYILPNIHSSIQTINIEIKSTFDGVTPIMNSCLWGTRCWL